ncbi:MAG: type IV secretory system conjugative DNA transfer family protein [Tateyamaria sp.]|uniref:type IV secretory system conjugative DNA transfer family protein n=1 Tax=Tateyamaria sp. TaxID=1929288 RepID=UPI00329C559B
MNEFVYYYGMTVVRIVMVAASFGAGFLIGWLLSPNSAGFRKVATYVIAAVLVLAAIFMNNIIGWNAALLLAIIAFGVGLAFWLGGVTANAFKMPDTFGSSRWATKVDLKESDLYGTDGIRIGKAMNEDGELDWVSYKSDRHLLTVAPTRSGKGTTQIITNLLTYEGSMLVIDPKGENAMITAKRRMEMGQEVYVVNPWGIVDIEGVEQATFNPMDWLDLRDIDMSENTMIMADALVMGNNHSDSFWDEESKALLQGLIAYVAYSPDEDGNRHLGRVRELLNENADDLTKLFKKMENSSFPIVKSTGARSGQKEAKLLANVLASTQAHTHFLDSKRLRDNMMTSSFKFEDLKTKPMTIYLVLPADRMNTFGRWLRLLVQQALTVNARNIEEKPEKPVLFVLDEFAALGRLNMVEQAYGLMAGFGMQLWGIVQDLSQLERIYGEGWQSFIANAGMINYFGSSDQKTAQYFSSMCGEKTVWSLSSAISHTFGTNSGPNGGTSSNSTSYSDTQSTAQRKLAYPDELMRLKGNEQIAFIENMYPLRADKVRWHDDPELKPLGVDLQAEPVLAQAAE